MPPKSGFEQNGLSVGRRLLCAGFFFLVAAALFGKFIFLGKALLLRDLYFEFLPRHLYVSDLLRQGIFPHWNPHTGCGEALAAESQAGVYYPPNLLFLLLAPMRALAILLASHFVLAALGLWLLLRQWGASLGGALLGATVFVCSGLMIGKIEFPSEFYSSAWYPMVFVAFIAACKKSTGARVALFAAALALQFLAGWPEASLYTAGSLGLYAIFLSCHAIKNHLGRVCVLRSFGVLAAGGVVALALSAALLLPMLETVSLSVRSTAGTASGQGSINPGMLFSLLLPSLYGVPGHFGRYWAPAVHEYWLGALYIGIVPLMLLLARALGAFAGRNAETPTRPGAATAPAWIGGYLVSLLALSLLYAMGRYTPFHGIATALLPPLRMLAWPGVSLMCTIFALSALAARAVDALPMASADGKLHRRVIGGSGAAAALLAIVAGGTLVNGGAGGHYLLNHFFNLDSVPAELAHRIPWPVLARDLAKSALVALAAAGIIAGMIARPGWRRLGVAALIGMTVADSWVSAAPSLRSADRAVVDKAPTPLVQDTEAYPPGRVLPLGSYQYLYGSGDAALYRLGRVSLQGSWSMVDGGYVTETSSAYALAGPSMLNSMLDDETLPIAVRQRLAALMNVSHVVDFPDLYEHFATGAPAETEVRQLDAPLPRAYIVGGMQRFPSQALAIDALATMAFDPLALVLVDTTGPMPMEARPAQRLDYQAEIEVYEANRIQIAARSDAPGYLVLSDSWHPGWKATVDGEDAPLYRANGAFRMVPVPSGAHLVSMTFDSATFRWGVAISILTWLAVSGVLVYAGVCAVRSRNLATWI